MSFGEKIKRKREKLGLTQEELSFQIHEDLSRQSISKWERGESFPDVENLLALAKTLGMHLDEMFADELAEMNIPDANPAGPGKTMISVKNEFPFVCGTMKGGSVRVISVSVEYKLVGTFHKYTVGIKGTVLKESEDTSFDTIQYKLLDDSDVVIDKADCDIENIKEGESFLISKIHLLHVELGNTCKITFI